MACLGLTQETKASREAIEVIEPSGGWLKIRDLLPLYPRPSSRADFFLY
jgi:hypothetical protein